MNTNRTWKDFYVSQRVNVEPLPDDVFSQPFTGYVVGFKQGDTSCGTLVQVKDLDDDTWDCVPEQVSPNTDEIMHADSCGHLTDDF